ncbi:hypothetical protein MES5069_660031 [Mesorhizobium escarrei]|uniref:Uncharacterized protein n=1 Tax=Mesorhizobium escarrei TaxID=666018 RepID=A0ABN8KGD8_9HYPH|nr:hypothetical protein MES5069_660031 [Mesorhizobium escarrei]
MVSGTSWSWTVSGRVEPILSSTPGRFTDASGCFFTYSLMTVSCSGSMMTSWAAATPIPASRSRGSITSQQVFGNPVEMPEAYAWRLSLKKPLFTCGRLEGIERGLLSAVSGQAFLDHSNCFKSGRLVHEWPWLLKRRLSIRYRRNQHRFVIQVDRNRYKRRHLRRSPELKWLNAKTWRWLQ